MKRVTLAWRKALAERSPAWARATLGPATKYLDMLFLDHGFVRVVYVNRHKLGEKAWRSAQPAPHHIRAWASEGVKTIVNLRGERMCGSYWLEEEACQRHGITLVNHQMRSRAAPSLAELHGVRDLFDRIEYPMLMHCKSGSDRAGLMSALYRIIVEGVPVETAKDELALRYGHFRQADTGILDAFFERYLADTADTPMDFFTWVDTVYDPDELAASFKPGGWTSAFVNWVLRRE